jgi:hypothetical protein
MTMRAMDWGRKRVKAQIVGIGREGEGLTWVVPKKKWPIEFNLWVLGEWLKWGFIGLTLFGCGILTGIIWWAGG